MPETYEYDAFISYRHLPLDQAVADRTQKLLETYKPPRGLGKDRIGRLFRDQTELPTSGDLDDALQRALASSRFLIVILSPRLKESKWCMEEIRSFKEAHGGKIDHILPVLVEGEPADSIPDILRHETRRVLRADNVEETVEVEVEPLCCDVRAETPQASLKKLRTEMLRLAAPMLGVGFDDLYRRNQRRKHRRMAVAAGATFSLMAAVVGVISYFAYQTYQAKQQFQRNLVDNYAREGASQIALSDDEKAMLYYANALKLDSGTQAAKTGALLLLQQHGWLNRVESGAGGVLGDRVYSGVSRPLAVGPSEGCALLYSSDGCRMIDTASGRTEDLSAYGMFLQSAPDGSSWSFATDTTVTFYFPEDGSVAQAALPDKINPLCSPEELELYGGARLSAAAVDRYNAVICRGGYLYLYRLDPSSPQGTLTETYDLALIFEEDASHGQVPVYCTVRTGGGSMFAVTGGSTTAIFHADSETASCLCQTHTQYGRNLQDVVFDQDGSYYALVYGNDIGIYDPGGCLEVYEVGGSAVMTTPFEGGVPLTGAAFEPEGTRIAAWGGGILEIYDWTTGERDTATLQIADIDALAWLEDGRLMAGDGNGTVDTYVIESFEAAGGSDVTLQEYIEPDDQIEEAVLRTGVRVSRSLTEMTVSDAQGRQLETRAVSSVDARISSVNRLFADEAHDTVYAWLQGWSSLLAFKAGENGFTSALALNTRGSNPLKLHSVYNGVLVETGTGKLYYFEDGQTEPSAILTPDAGTVMGVASDGTGLVSVALRNRVYTQSVSFTDFYSAQLWDLNKNLLLAELARDSRQEITMLTFSQGRMSFMQGSKTVSWLLDAPVPDETVIHTLGSMTCYSLDENQNALLAAPSFDPAALGSWGALLQKRAPAETVETFEARMERVLQEQGQDAWLDAYAVWWSSEEPASLSLSDVADRAVDFLDGAWNLGREDVLRPALERAFALVSEDMEPDSVAEVKITNLLSRVGFYAPQNVDLVIDYTAKRAEYFEAKFQKSQSVDDLFLLYASLLDKCRVSGDFAPDPDTYFSQISTDDATVQLLLNYYKLLELMQRALLLGAPEQAARAWDLSQSVTGPDAFVRQCLLFDLGSLVKRGILSEADYSSFVEHLEDRPGLRVNMISSHELQAGLRRGDLLLAVNGVYFGQWQYLRQTGINKQAAELTVLRDGNLMTVSVPANWQISGYNDVA